MKPDMNRRQAFRALAGLGLVACNTSKPRTGALGFMERFNQGIQSFLVHDATVEASDLTPEQSFPSYFVAPKEPVAPPGWRLKIGGRVKRPMSLTLDELMKLPRTESRIEHHCVEGWSAVADWAGVRISDIAKHVGAEDVDYVDFQSFDVPKGESRGYSSSWDRDSAMHPQTMIAYGMNGRPLSPAHGAPARLYGSVKLGYKQVKYLTEVNFVDRETGGYWEDRGYEWFGGA